MSRRTPFVLGTLAVIAGVVAGSNMVAADPITLTTDQVRLLTFKRPVKTVFVANPLIADITVIDSSRAFLQGKTLGTTQVIALDENGRETMNDQITVLNQPGTVVTLQRGKAQSTLNCMDERCQTTAIVGDAPEPFQQTLEQIQKSNTVKEQAGN
jgi:Flp pilus assembly secretin CpaC